MKKGNYYILAGILGIVVLFLPGLCQDVNAQTPSVSLNRVTVGDIGSQNVQLYFSFEDLPADYDYANDGLVVFVLKYTLDTEDNLKKYLPIDTISSADVDFMTMMDDGTPLSWSNPSSDHDNGPERYALKLEDLAGNALGIISPGHQTIFLDEISDQDIDRCNGSINMSWENYKVFSTTSGSGDEELPSFFTHNRIMYVPPGGGGEQVAATLDFNTEDYEFEFKDGSGNYTIWVQAVEVDGGSELRTSNSNYRSVPFESPVLTGLDIATVDIINNSGIEVVFDAGGGQPGDLDDFVFVVYRSDSLNGEYTQLQGNYIDVNMGTPSPIARSYSFADNNIPDIQSGPFYYYVTGHLDECEVEFISSLVVSSLYLTGNIDIHSGAVLTVLLEGAHFPGGMDYSLYRKLPWDDDWEEVVLLGTGLSFLDDLSMHIDSLAGEILYQLKGTSGADVVVSNEVSIYINVGLEVYNAFRPSSSSEANRTFRPRLKGVTPTYFRLQVYNHWGQEMYSFINQSGSLNDWPGWDGKSKDGQDVVPGVYGYRIEYQIGNDERVEKTGVVTLLR